ncbi:MAG: PRC-barrel domain-containing protein [Candidatus Thermoplasmatota archaeon]
MIEELSDLIGLHVYTNKGIFLGAVDNVVIETDQGKLYGFYVGDTNPLLVEGSQGIVVPFRWAKTIGDVVILRYFPSGIAPKASP